VIEIQWDVEKENFRENLKKIEKITHFAENGSKNDQK